MNQAEVHHLFVALKAALKERRLTYRDIATGIGLSETSVKRIFAGEDCNVSRLSSICDFIGVSLFELIAYSQQQTITTYSLPEETEELFADQFDLFIFYRYLERGLPTAEVAKVLDLDRRTLNSYLKQLDDLELIDRIPGGRVRIRLKGHLRIKKEGRLRRLLEQKWVPTFVSDVIENKPSPHHYLRIISTGLTRGNRKELEREIEQLASRTTRQGHIDRSISYGTTESLSLVVCIGPRRAGEFHNL